MNATDIILLIAACIAGLIVLYALVAVLLFWVGSRRIDRMTRDFDPTLSRLDRMDGVGSRTPRRSGNPFSNTYGHGNRNRPM